MNKNKKKLKKDTVKYFYDNEEMFKICSNINNLSIFNITKLAYDLGFSYEHIEEISKEKSYEKAKEKLKEFILINQLNYYKLANSVDEEKRQTIYNMNKTENNYNKLKILVLKKKREKK